MTKQWVSTFQTLGVLFVATGVCLAPICFSHAADNSPDQPGGNYYPFPPADSCATLQKAFSDAYSAVGALCGDSEDSGGSKKNGSWNQCIRTKLKTCSGKNVEEAKAKILGGTDGDDGDSGSVDPQSSCEAVREIKDQCPGLLAVTPEDAARSRKESRNLRDQLDKERKESRQDDADKQKQGQQDANKIMDEQMKNDQDYAQKRKDLTDQLNKTLQGISADSMKAIQDMQTKLDQIDVEYIQYRDQLRRKTSVANDTELAWNVQCRAAANDVASQAEAELNKRMDAEAAFLKNYRFSSLSGQTSRNLKLKRQRILNKYNEFLAQCLAGAKDPGASLKMKLSQAKNDVRDSENEAADKAARLEKLRGQIASNVNAVAQQLSAQKQQAILSNQQELALLDQAHNANAQRLQQRQQQMMQNQWMDNMRQGQAQKQQNDRLNEIMADEATASADYMCYDKMSKEQITDSQKKTSDGLTAIYTLRHLCSLGDEAKKKCDPSAGNTNACAAVQSSKTPTPTADNLTDPAGPNTSASSSKASKSKK
jgi:hypothetical protein